jgi:hypothetical protein
MVAVVPADTQLSWVSVTLRLVGHIGFIVVWFVAASFAVSWRDDLMNCTVSRCFRMSGGKTVAFRSGSSDWVPDGFSEALCYTKYRGSRICFESSVFAWLWLLHPCFIFVCHNLQIDEVIGRYKFWASFLMRHVAGYKVRNWVLLWHVITRHFIPL